MLRQQIANGVTRKRIGIMGDKGLAPRQHMNILNKDGSEIVGEVTSGGFSPCLQKPIAMGYVRPEYTEIDTQLQVEIKSGKCVNVNVCQLPFVPKGYYKS